MESTQRLALPLIQPGQAQKELTHNEALQRLDVLVGGAVEENPRNSPPASPAPGACYIVGPSPTGEWVGKSGHVAGWTAAGYRYVAPTDGLSLLIRTTGTHAVYRGGAWDLGTVNADKIAVGGQQVVGARAGAIADPTGGATADSESRSAIGAILAAMRAHGLIAT